MNEFFESPFVQDLKNGNLPTVEVSVETKSIVTLALAILIVGVVLILGSKMLAKC